MLMRRMIPVVISIFTFVLIAGPSLVRGDDTGTTDQTLYLPFITNVIPIRLDHVRISSARGAVVQIRGEVVNRSRVALHSVMIAAEFYPDTPQSETRIGTTLLPVVLPGQPNLFVIGGPSTTGGEVPYKVTVQSWQEHNGPEYQAATVVRADICDVYDYYNRFCLELRNDQPRELRNVQALVWSEQGGEFQLWSQPQGAVLVPGQTVSLRIDPPFYSKQWPGDTRAVAQGLQAP